jgi:hypothetical protein
VAPRILKSLGRPVQELGVPESGQFTATSALMHYVLGAASQNAANGHAHTPADSRDEFLGAVSRQWQELDPDDYRFTRAVAAQLRDHDDRAQFLAGVDLILTGITAGR